MAGVLATSGWAVGAKEHVFVEACADFDEEAEGFLVEGFAQVFYACASACTGFGADDFFDGLDVSVAPGEEPLFELNDGFTELVEVSVFFWLLVNGDDGVCDVAIGFV